MLAVTTPRVRALIASGDLPAVKVGRAWLVEREAVEQRVELEPGDGRQFVPARAWGLLFLANGLFPDWLSPQDRWRLSAFLPRLRSGDLRSRMTRRGQSHCYHAHTSLIDRARKDPDLMLTGPSASEALHLGLVGGDEEVEAYVDEDALAVVKARYHLAPADAGNVTLRVVPAFGWTWPALPVAPHAAVALDLLEHREPRARQVGSDLLGTLAR